MHNGKSLMLHCYNVTMLHSDEYLNDALNYQQYDRFDI